MRAKTAKPGRGHHVAIVMYDGLSLLEFAIATDVFGPQSWLPADEPWYRMSVCAAGPVRTAGGLTVSPTHTLTQLGRADTVVVVPTETPELVPPAVLAALRRAHDRGARIVSLCTGAFVLAAAGLLDGRPATTHWDESTALAERYPSIAVDPQVLYVDDGDILTSAGSAASFDLCLHVVTQDFGAERATQLARQLVVPPHRDGGQAQYIETPLPRPRDAGLFEATLTWLLANLDEPVTVSALATRAAMSPRTFARRFHDAVGATPYQWLLHQRLQRAQRLLETTALPVDAVAARSGLGDAANLRKHFARHVRTSPQDYRATFGRIAS